MPGDVFDGCVRQLFCPGGLQQGRNFCVFFLLGKGQRPHFNELFGL